MAERESHEDGMVDDGTGRKLARERAEIAARVASFRETQQKFKREREEYYAKTMGNAWSGFVRPAFQT